MDSQSHSSVLPVAPAGQLTLFNLFPDTTTGKKICFTTKNTKCTKGKIDWPLFVIFVVEK